MYFTILYTFLEELFLKKVAVFLVSNKSIMKIKNKLIKVCFDHKKNNTTAINNGIVMKIRMYFAFIIAKIVYFKQIEEILNLNSSRKCLIMGILYL